MMRALAGISAAAVALIALPTTVGVAAEAETDTAVAIAATPSTSGITAFFEERAILGLNMGAFLWLTVAALAVVFAAMAVSHSRSHGSQVIAAPSFLTAPPVPSVPATPVRATTSVTSAQRSPASRNGFVIADTSRGR